MPEQEKKKRSERRETREHERQKRKKRNQLAWTEGRLMALTKLKEYPWLTMAMTAYDCKRLRSCTACPKSGPVPSISKHYQAFYIILQGMSQERACPIYWYWRLLESFAQNGQTWMPAKRLTMPSTKSTPSAIVSCKMLPVSCEMISELCRQADLLWYLMISSRLEIDLIVIYRNDTMLIRLQQNITKHYKILQKCSEVSRWESTVGLCGTSLRSRHWAALCRSPGAMEKYGRVLPIRRLCSTSFDVWSTVSLQSDRP